MRCWNGAFCTLHNLQYQLIWNSTLSFLWFLSVCYLLTLKTYMPLEAYCWLFSPTFMNGGDIFTPSARSLEDQPCRSLWSPLLCLSCFPPRVKMCHIRKKSPGVKKGEMKNHVRLCLDSKFGANPLNLADSEASSASLLFHVQGKHPGCHHWQRKCQNGCLHP